MDKYKYHYKIDIQNSIMKEVNMNRAIKLRDNYRELNKIDNFKEKENKLENIISNFYYKLTKEKLSKYYEKKYLQNLKLFNCEKIRSKINFNKNLNIKTKGIDENVIEYNKYNYNKLINNLKNINYNSKLLNINNNEEDFYFNVIQIIDNNNKNLNIFKKIN